LAVRSLILVSGGSVIAILTFLGNLWTKDDALARMTAHHLQRSLVLLVVVIYGYAGVPIDGQSVDVLVLQFKTARARTAAGRSPRLTESEAINRRDNVSHSTISRLTI